MALTLSSPVASHDRVERLENALAHVVFKDLVGEALVRVDPGDDEDGVSLRHRPFDERFFRVEVEDVELVDPGRHDQERALEYLFRGRLVLDELQQLVLEDDLARRDGEVAPDLELAGVGLPDLEVPPPRLMSSASSCMPRTRFSPSEAKVSRRSSGLVNTQFDGASALITCFM